MAALQRLDERPSRYFDSDPLSSKLISTTSVTGRAKLRAAIIVSKTKTARARTLTPAVKKPFAYMGPLDFGPAPIAVSLSREAVASPVRGGPAAFS
jgi:hypothetical protein